MNESHIERKNELFTWDFSKKKEKCVIKDDAISFR